jgi:hypothetical protein
MTSNASVIGVSCVVVLAVVLALYWSGYERD